MVIKALNSVKKKVLFDMCLNIVAAALPIAMLQLIVYPQVAKEIEIALETVETDKYDGNNMMDVMIALAKMLNRRLPPEKREEMIRSMSEAVYFC